MSKPSTGLRTVKMWVRYNPKRREIVDQKPFKNQLAEPSKSSGDVIFEMRGFYVPTLPEPPK